MIIETKYNIGDCVYHVMYTQKQIKKPCPSCNSKGRINLKKQKFNCPDCYGRGTKESYSKRQWMFDVPLTIGSIRYDSARSDETTTYMCNETGVGSGSIYHEEDLFLTKEEAEVECAKRSKLDKEENKLDD